MITIEDLRTERLEDPIGLGTSTPRLTWKLRATGWETDVLQTAYHVQVGVEDDVIWETGLVEGRDQQVVYAGPPLGSRARCWWRVCAWTTEGNAEPIDTGWSESAHFELGLLEPGDWSAQLITADAATPVVRFSKRFDVTDPAQARLYVTSHGAFIAEINGERVGDEILAPGWTTYRKRLAVRTHSVTDLIGPGSNEIAITVAPGWFSGRLGWGEGKRVYGEHVGVLAQLEVRSSGGAIATVATGDGWTATSTQFLEAEIYDGETFDARDHTPQPAEVTTVDLDLSTLVAPAVPPVRRTQASPPEGRTVLDDGTIALDFGQNLVGYMRITVRGATPGNAIVMRHAEVLGPDGRLFTAPLRNAKATDTYIARGDAEETYEPSFTFHGFRYAEITGASDVDVEAVVVHSDLERIGAFSSSNDLVNKLHTNVIWGQRGNFVSVPTDCPQRDERLGWTGDAQVFSPTASYLYDCETFWENWLADVAADQRDDGMVPPIIPDIEIGMGTGAAGWGDAAVVVPWTTYEAYGDATVLRSQLGSMQRWVDWVHSRLDDDERWAQDFQFGDWLDPDAPTSEPWKAKARFDLVASAYAFRITDLFARAADLVDELELSGRYVERANLIRDAWWRNYGEEAAKTQTGCALAICFGLAPDEGYRAQLGDALAERVREAGNHLATGFLGTPLLLPALTLTGHVDVAYDVLLQTTPPSWLYTVLAGGTTIWERWDALRPDGSVPLESLGTGSGDSMVSFNHYAYGAVAEWLHTSVAGLAPDATAPGYRHVIIKPHPGGGLTKASAELDSRYGLITVAWSVEGDSMELSVQLPANTTATVTLPDGRSADIGSGTRMFSSELESV